VSEVHDADAAPVHCLHFRADGRGQTRNLVDVWELASWQVIVDNEPLQDVFGSHPKGYPILTREGRAIVLTTARIAKRERLTGRAPRSTAPCSRTPAGTELKATTL
jgi:hypothetical protein